MSNPTLNVTKVLRSETSASEGTGDMPWNVELQIKMSGEQAKSATEVKCVVGVCDARTMEHCRGVDLKTAVALLYIAIEANPKTNTYEIGTTAAHQLKPLCACQPQFRK